jgi:Two component regulator propeller.
MTPFFRALINTFFLFTVSIYGQSFQKEKVNNITSNRTASISQDSLGFLWFGTDEGLNKYDGIENKQYKSNIFDEKTLSSNRIRDIYIDKNNNVWILNDRGLDLYEELTDNFIRFPTKTKPVHLVNKKDYIYITTSQSGVFVLNKKNRQMRTYSFDPLDPLSISSSRFSSKQTNPIAISDETMWLGTQMD